MTHKSILNIAAYRFVEIDNLLERREALQIRCQQLALNRRRFCDQHIGDSGSFARTISFGTENAFIEIVPLGKDQIIGDQFTEEALFEMLVKIQLQCVKPGNRVEGSNKACIGTDDNRGHARTLGHSGHAKNTHGYK